MTGQPIFDVIDGQLQASRDRPLRRHALAAAVVVAIYGALALATWGAHTTRGPRNIDRTAVAALDLANQPTVELVAPPAPAPMPAAAVPARASPARPPPRRHAAAPASAPTAPAPPIAPARAASIVTTETPSAPPPRSADAIVTGEAASSPGGTTAPTIPAVGTVSGVGSIASDATATRQATPGGSGDGADGRADQARPVTLAAGTWSCAWPAEADAEQIDEQTVILRVGVATDGTVQQAQIVSDPGRGFGRAAVACARATRFRPALDRRGRPLAAWSPPIRVHFSR
jgi:protein TonB